MHLIMGLVLVVLALLAISLLRTYTSLPPKELKLRAREGNQDAKLLYRAAAYGNTLRTFLWIIIGLSSAGFFILVSRAAPWWFAISSSALLIWLGFVWLPNRQVTRLSTWLAARLSGALAWVLSRLHPVIDVFHVRLGSKNKKVHTGIYDKQDLIDLLNSQKKQTDSRINKTELEIAIHAMTFGDVLIRQAMIPRRVVISVSSKDAVGPVLMDELHDSGHSRFPVYEGKEDNMVGTLYLRDLLNKKHGGAVADIMRKDVYYVHEEQTLHDALQAILKTRHHLLLVVNSFEEYVGIITIEDVLEQIIGQAIMDEFDQYQDLRAVAARAAKIEHKNHDESSVPTEKTV